MSFVSPWLAILAGAAAVPALLLLYFLKLRRRYVRIPSTMLWQQAAVELQVNAPFQRLRASWLLLLQMLMLVLVLLALAQPRLEGSGASAERYVVLVDVSASMSAGAGDGASRFERAKEQAVRLVRRTSRGMRKPEFMVMAVGATPRIVSTWQRNSAVVEEAIESLAVTDEEADLQAALRLAGSLTGAGEEGEEPPEVVLFSDGAMGASGREDGFTLSAGRFRFVQVAEGAGAGGNIGVTALTVRRDADDPGRVQVLARVISTFGEPRNVGLTLLADGVEQGAQVVRLEGAGEAAAEATVVFRVGLDPQHTAVLMLRQNVGDELASDDTAGVLVLPEFRPRIALVQSTEADEILPEILRATEPASLSVMTEAEYAALDEAEVDSGKRFDFAVFDRVSPARLPGIPTLTFGGTAAGVESASRPAVEERGEKEEGGVVLTWDRGQRVMRNVELDNVRYRGFSGFAEHPLLTPLASGRGGAVIVSTRARGATHVLVGFALSESNWRLDVSLLVMIQNMLEDLPGRVAAEQGLAGSAGQPVTLRAAGDAREIVMSRGMKAVRAAAEGGRLATIRAPSETGAWEVSGAEAGVSVLPVSVLSEMESDIRPGGAIRVNAEASRGTGVSEAAAMELWPMFAGAVVVLLVIEWLVYSRQAATG